jgi:hypothetical protein
MKKFVPIVKRKRAKAAGLVDQTTEPVVTVKEQRNRIVISYTFPGFFAAPREIEVAGKTRVFNNLSVQSAGSIGKAGKPGLPSFARYVQIPFASDFSVSADVGKPVEFDDYVATPSQSHLRDNPDEDQELRFVKSAYTSKKPYPEKVLETSGPYVVDGYRVLLVHVRPLQFVASEEKILAYRTIKVTINLVDKGDPNKVIDNQGSDLDAFGNLLLNPGRSIDRRLRFRRPPVAGLRMHGPEFLIIYDPNLEKAAKRLKRWKNRKGIRTEMGKVGEIGTTVEEIKQYIRNRRRFAKIGNQRFPSRLRYVLLFGDFDVIPLEEISVGPSGGNVTDYYYSTSGDPSHATDLVFPWLAIGRIPVSDEETAVGVVKQIIRYERRPPADPDYYNRMTFAAYFQDWDQDHQAEAWYVKTMEEIREHMIEIGFDVERVYIHGGTEPHFYEDGSPVPEDVKDAFEDYDETRSMLIDATSEGRLIIAHRDHATETGWSNPWFQNYDLQAIDTTEQSIFLSLNCSSGAIDTFWYGNCFAENLLCMEGGAPSLIAATRNSNTLLNDDLMRALFDGLWAGMIPSFPDASTASYGIRNCRLGDILNYAKSYLPIAMSEGNDFIKEHFEIYHVIGDPTLEIWKEAPRVVRMRVKLVQRFGSARPFLSIHLSECPTGSVLTIWHNQELIKRIEPRTTHIMLPIGDLVSISPWGQPSLPHSKRRLEICFSAPGYRFRSKRVDG